MQQGGSRCHGVRVTCQCHTHTMQGTPQVTGLTKLSSTPAPFPGDSVEPETPQAPLFM